MSQYLTYSQYKSYGGKAEEPSFLLLERLARAKLDYWTQGRIKEAGCDIQLCMVLLIDALAQARETDGAVSGYSNDGVSVSLGTPRTEEEIMSSVYDRIVEILPVELVSVVIG